MRKTPILQPRERWLRPPRRVHRLVSTWRSISLDVAKTSYNDGALSVLAADNTAYTASENSLSVLTPRLSETPAADPPLPPRSWSLSPGYTRPGLVTNKGAYLYSTLKNSSRNDSPNGAPRVWWGSRKEINTLPFRECHATTMRRSRARGRINVRKADRDGYIVEHLRISTQKECAAAKR